MRRQAFRPVATIISILLLATVPAQAGPVSFSQVVHVMSNMQDGGGQRTDLRLRSVQQGASTPTTSSSQTPSSSNQTVAQASISSATQEPTTLIAGAATTSPQDPNVQVIDEGDVEGTVCDCGEFRIPGGWPKWPLLAAIPLVCVTGVCDRGDQPRCIPGIDAECTPGDEIPEPASLLLLGSGLLALGAGARRRLSRVKADNQEVTTMEV